MNRSNQSAGEVADTPASVPQGPESKTVDPTVPALFRKIADLAGQLDAVVNAIFETGAPESEASGCLLATASSLAAQIGWTADLGSIRSGQALNVNRGGAEDWLLPPDCMAATGEAGQ